MVKPPCGSARPAQHAATRQPAAAARSIRPPASTARLRRFAPPRRVGRWRAAGWKRPILKGLTVTPASPAASDALPGTPLPHAQKRARWALAGFLGTGSSASSRKARALWLHRSRQALHGPARLAGEAAART